jgi:chromosomal replication initiator protein
LRGFIKESPMTAVMQVMEDRVSETATAQLDWVAHAPGDLARDSRDPAEPIAAALAAAIGAERFDLWFDRKTRFVLAGNTLIVEVGNAFAARWIGSKFHDALLSAARAILGRDVELAIQVSELPQLRPPEMPVAPACAISVPPAGPSGNPAAAPAPLLHAKYTLEEFVVGPSNQLAYHAALRVAEKPGQEFNPLFIHGHCGLGKTHLLQGICLRFSKLHPGQRWLYLTGEQFTNDFLVAIRTHKTDAFRRKLRHTDLLVLDDVHFLAHKKATQEEFLHTFNQVDAHGKQIVLASDCAPKQIQALSDQLSSRFISGMVLRVDSPDLPTRLEILRRRAAKNGWHVGDAVLMHIARTATSSVRELEGMLLQVVAGIDLINQGQGGAQDVLASLRERTAMKGPVPVERIVAAVAGHFALAEAVITGIGRDKIVCAARALTMHLARQHTGMSYPEIGRALGHKNHSTVIAACQRVEAMLSGGELLCWNTPTGPRHQAIADILHDLESALRRR